MHEHIFDSFPSALDALSEKLRARVFSADEYHIVLTPDRYTLRVERALFSGGGAIDCEVLTLSRLCRRVVGSGKILSREAGVMLTARAIAAAGEPEYFGRAARYFDFAREAYETLLQIESSGTTPDALSADGITGQKLRDLKRIKAEYDRLKSGFSDSPDRLKELAAAAKKSELISKSHFYAIGYKNTTKLNAAVFKEISKYARSFEYYDAMPPRPRKTLTVYEAPDAVSQYKAVAADIRDYIYKGGGRTHYGDIAVVCPQPRALQRILNEYGIAYYADSTTSLYDTPPLFALHALYTMSARGADTKTLVGFAKDPYSGCERIDAERLELKLEELGIDYDASAVTTGDESADRALERVRADIAAFRSGSDFAEALEKAMEFCAFSDVFKVHGVGETDLIAPIYDLIELLKNYGEGGGSFDADASTFFSAARSVEVKSLPRYSDRVRVVMPQSLRLDRCKKLYIVDFNEGVLPQVTADDGLLSDAELEAFGNVVEPSARDKNRRDREELAAVAANADDVFLAYSTAGGARRSAFIAELCDAGGIVERSYAQDARALAQSDDAAYIAKFACVPAAAREIAARRSTKYFSSVLSAVGACENVSPPFEPIVPIERKTLSVSELSHWFGCPYKRFLSDSVGLKEWHSSHAADFGLVMHEFMRRWIKTRPLDASRENVERTINSVLDDAGYLLGAHKKTERERIVRDACDYASLNKHIIESGSYEPALAEKPFGGGIMLGCDGKVGFVGVIDRIDVCGDRARIIDYKTGNKKFDVKKCLDGTDMQLPLYAATVKDKKVTGVFYLPLGPMYAERGAGLSGSMEKDVDVALEYDAALSSGGKSDVVPVRLKLTDGQPTGFVRASAALMTRDDFDGLIERCVNTASLAADEINSGYIERTPNKDACRFCAYKALCPDKKPRGIVDDEGEEEE